MKPTGKVYVGVRLPPLNSAGEAVVLVLDPERQQAHYLPHICDQHTPRAKALLAHYGCHSPTGFNWGYGGSGPSELAFMLLLDLGIADERAWMAHNPLTTQIIAGLQQDQPWMLSARRLRTWLLHFENGMLGRKASPEEVAHAIREAEGE